MSFIKKFKNYLANKRTIRDFYSKANAMFEVEVNPAELHKPSQPLDFDPVMRAGTLFFLLCILIRTALILTA